MSFKDNGAEVRGTGSATQNLAVTFTTFNYGDTPISFRNEYGSVMVNATQMAKRFGKRPNDWLNNQQTKELINELSITRNLVISDLQQVRVGSPDNGGGTWLHEDLALIFAQWLSPAFYIWCNDRIKELLTQGVATIANDDETILRAIKVLERRVEEAKALVARKDKQLESKSRAIEHYSAITDKARNSSLHYTVTEVAKEFGFKSAGALYRLLESKGYVFKSDRRWFPTEKFPQKFWKWSEYHITLKDGRRLDRETLHLTEAFVTALRIKRTKNSNN